MMLSRRAALIAALAAATQARAEAGPRARLRPDTLSALGFTPLPRERVEFRASGLAGTVIVPVARVALRAVVPLADRAVALLSFAADRDAPAGRLDLAAIVGCDADGLLLLALEVLRWQAEPAHGGLAATLSTRISATGDRSALLLRRDAAVPRGNLTQRRESWTDVLAWRNAAPLADTPPWPPLKGTWQHRLSQDRARVIAALSARRDAVTEDLLALCGPPTLDVDLAWSD